ncbi:50S ribosomal protein L10 [Cesiribacter sp. SM1]|uniref:50S ribosomal protein L10 n=1 Tax=Cesiribacter sp. SM1 TaxID=2861196 RepID=UPI001CD34CFF|nr:50S ribosomal protein L10 [Cesiribacter sp. SM1]
MTREEKAQIIEDLQEKFRENMHFYITDASGMTVAEVNALRRQCFQSGLEYRVIKNTFIAKALEGLDADFSGLNEKVLKGFSGVLFSKENGNAPAKLIQDFQKKHSKKLTFKGASIDTDLFIGAEQLDMLTKLKSKQELIGEIIGLLNSPVQNVLGALNSGKHIIAGVVKTLQEKQQSE